MSTRLTYDKSTRSYIPRLGSKFPIAIQSTHGCPCTIEGRRTQMPNRLRAQLELNKLSKIISWVGTEIIWKSSRNYCMSQICLRGDVDGPIIQEGTLT